MLYGTLLTESWQRNFAKMIKWWLARLMNLRGLVVLELLSFGRVFPCRHSSVGWLSVMWWIMIAFSKKAMEYIVLTISLSDYCIIVGKSLVILRIFLAMMYQHNLMIVFLKTLHFFVWKLEYFSFWIHYSYWFYNWFYFSTISTSIHC